MWDDLASELEGDLEDLDRLRSEFAELLSRAAVSEPTRVEAIALAGILHSFYGGVENALHRIEKASGVPSPKTASWHADLLREASRSTAARKAVIGQESWQLLKLYLGFRHIARHQYSFRIEWSRMEHLVRMLPEAANRWEADLRRFIEWLSQKTKGPGTTET